MIQPIIDGSGIINIYTYPVEKLFQFREELAKFIDIILSLPDLKTEKVKKAVADSGFLLGAKLIKAISEPARFEVVKDDLKALLQRSEAQKEGFESIVEKAQGILRQIDSYKEISIELHRQWLKF